MSLATMLPCYLPFSPLRRPLILLPLLLLPLRPHRLPPHEVARAGEERRIERAPDEQDAQVEPDARVQVEEGAAGGLDDVVQRPSVAPVVPAGREVEGVEGGRDVGDDPEDEPHGRPGLADDHGDILAREPERDHADEVDHPVDGEGAAAVGIGVGGDGRLRGRGVREGNLEGERDEGVGERHAEVGRHGAEPADEDELPELDGRVPDWGHELAVDGQEEGEAEEGDDDEVDEPDGDGRRRGRRAEGPQTELGEADGRAQGLRGRLEVGDWDAGVAEDHARPHLAEFGGDFGLEAREGRKDVVVNGVLIPCCHPHCLTGPQGVVTGIALLYRLLEERRSVRVDDDCRPCLEVIHSLPNLQWIIVEEGRIHCHETQMVPGLSRRYHFLGSLGD